MKFVSSSRPMIPSLKRKIESFVTKLETLLQSLGENDLEFIVVGQMAAVMHGLEAQAEKLEIALLMSPGNLQKLRRLLKPALPKHRDNPKQKYSFLDVPENLRGWRSFFLETELGLLDLLGDVKGVGSFSRIRERSISLEFLGKSWKVMSRDDLALSKAAEKSRI